MAAKPIGRLIQNTQRQVKCWAKKPPSTGPPTLVAANTALK